MDSKLLRNLTAIASVHRLKTLKQAAFRGWVAAAKLTKRLERRITSSFKRKPAGLFLLVALISNSWTDSGSDLFEFYSYCLATGKVKKSKLSKFSRIVQFGVKSKLALLFATWKQRSATLKSIQTAQQMRLKSAVIAGLKSTLIIS